MMKGCTALSLTLLVALAALMVPVEGFVRVAPGRRIEFPVQKNTVAVSRNDSHLGAKKDKLLSVSSTTLPDYYSDDLFGLIFLSGVFLLQDYVFASVFLVLSAIAAIFTNVLQRLPPGPAVPGYVGGCTLVASIVVRQLLGEDADVVNSSAITAPESLLCIGSLLYGLFPRDSDDNE